MSADLLEAFGSDQAHTPRKTHTNISAGSQVTPRPQPFGAGHTGLPVASERPLWEKDHQGADVLFDAAGDDEFGDFEDASVNGLQAENHVQSNTDLLGIEDSTVEHQVKHDFDRPSRGLPATDRSLGVLREDEQQPAQQPRPTIIRESREDDEGGDDDEWGDFEDVRSDAQPVEAVTLKTTQAPVPTPIPIRIPTHTETITSDNKVDDDNEDWGDFRDGPPTVSQPRPNLSEIDAQTSATKDAPVAASTPDIKLEINERPTNIPPPFTLLQLLPTVIQRLSTEVKPSVDTQQTSSTAEQILHLYRTIARIISGRTHRWKRDTILSQSMRISFAGHKTSGMKLQTLDRGEAVKEEQEALEVVSAWSRYSHVLNAALSRAKLQRPAMSLSADMKIRSATGAGVLTAREACAICGLKRNERVLGIDTKIDDVFGEFWVEHWGHRDCFVWWHRYRDLLQQR